jgi:hypothetical protein
MGFFRRRIWREETGAEAILVVHPLDDGPEAKADTSHLGPMPMTRTVWWSLVTLRAYLIVMILLVIYQFLTLAGLLPHHAP